jgi:hypothetical protein
MSSVQLFAIVFNVARLCLIAGVYFGSANSDNSYVSTSMEMLTPFKLCLTLLVFTETIICIAYITILTQFPIHPTHALLASVFACFALGGWTALASVPLDNLSHQLGTVVYLLGSAGLHAILVKNAKAENTELGIMWASVVACGFTFLVTCYLPITSDASAVVEWIGFMLEATVFILFYVMIPPGGTVSQPDKDDDSGDHTENTSPLLHGYPSVDYEM